MSNATQILVGKNNMPANPLTGKQEDVILLWKVHVCPKLMVRMTLRETEKFNWRQQRDKYIWMQAMELWSSPLETCIWIKVSEFIHFLQWEGV